MSVCGFQQIQNEGVIDMMCVCVHDGKRVGE